MANSDPSPPLPRANPLSSKKENITPIGSKIAELNESRAELLNRIQGLKQVTLSNAFLVGIMDLQNWRSKLDTQVMVYRNELSDLKKSLNVEVEQLRSEFQELRTTLQQQQQEDATSSLRNLGLQDVTTDAKNAQAQDCRVEGSDKEGHILPKEEDDNDKESES
ncbi:uncharacterized protein LOC121252974 isoform X1 [Juglans microcarpa x Juglans regia]|uniref:uncharacterized protein LOC121252974 isoform X1 n=1 Tax=Juglans microcarpa x Juglans regia TaxID=2249226 RepID=UPI001B7DA8C9|nr:uncharacterized protein LOC121252974 isoform X1 [Juglans microcarpa x Juglans regia]